MSSTFTDATGTTYTPTIIDSLSWKYTPNTVSHKIINPSTAGALTNIGAGVLSGTLSVVFIAGADADAFARAASTGVTFSSAGHPLNGETFVATDAVQITPDDETRAAFVVAFDWGVAS